METGLMTARWQNYTSPGQVSKLTLDYLSQNITKKWLIGTAYNVALI